MLQKKLVRNFNKNRPKLDWNWWQNPAKNWWWISLKNSKMETRSQNPAKIGFKLVVNSSINSNKNDDKILPKLVVNSSTNFKNDEHQKLGWIRCENPAKIGFKSMIKSQQKPPKFGLKLDKNWTKIGLKPMPEILPKLASNWWWNPNKNYQKLDQNWPQIDGEIPTKTTKIGLKLIKSCQNWWQTMANDGKFPAKFQK